MILSLYLTSEWSKSLIVWWLCFKKEIGCPLYTNWYDSLGSSWNGPSGHVKRHPFYLVKNSSVHRESFRCISLYMLMSSAHPAPLFFGYCHIAAAPGEQLGVRCLAQGSHLSHGKDATSFSHLDLGILCHSSLQILSSSVRLDGKR